MGQFRDTPETPHTPANFTTHPICVIGGSPALDGPDQWKTWQWGVHSITFRSEDVPLLPGGPARLYDACAASKVDLAGLGYRNPAAWHNTGTAVLWTFPSYWYWEPATSLRGLISSPKQAQPVNPVDVLWGRPALTTLWRSSQ